MVSNADDQLIVRWCSAGRLHSIALDRGPEFQVEFYFLAETSRPKILEDILPFREYFDVQVLPEYESQDWRRCDDVWVATSLRACQDARLADFLIYTGNGVRIRRTP